MKFSIKYLLTAIAICFYIIIAIGSSPSKQIVKEEIKIPSIWPTITKSEDDIRKYFDENKDKLDPIEGIYTNRQTFYVDGVQQRTISQYRIAIVNRKEFSINDESSYEFIAIILESDNKEWTPGRIKAYFRKTAYQNFYECKWFMQNYNPSKMDFILETNGILSSREESTEYNDFGRAFKIINETILLRIFPLFDASKLSDIRGSSKDITLKGTGSGFLISNSGLLVTNYHVVAEGSRFDILFPIKGITKTAKIKIKDIQNDIAILEIDNFSLNEISAYEIPYSFADNLSVKVGQEVYTLGFPLGDIMGTTPRLATGTINSLYGIEEDPRLYQISNPIQPGNSGGALFNKKGELVGICVSGLNAKYFYENQGIIPQNMNFAIKGSYLKNLIGMLPESNNILNRVNTVKQGTLEEQIDQLNPFIVQIRVY
ncbi:MAG: serine protease [Candidatus Kapabacteria bacterium]|nr:serine protease [Candidatus Kapabacteria bacterium]